MHFASEKSRREAETSIDTEIKDPISGKFAGVSRILRQECHIVPVQLFALDSIFQEELF